MNTLEQRLDNSLGRVESALVAGCRSDAVLAEQIGQHLLSLGGKRIRAKLVLLAADICNVSVEVAEHLAVILEWLHAATLLHDDVIDDADQRRHQLSARYVWGNSASVLAGDFLYSLAFKSISELNHLEAIRELSIATQMVVEGEVKQLSKRQSVYNNLDEYLAIIGGKTAKLFEVAVALPAICADADASVVSGLRAFGYNFGLVYQVVDDIIDCFASELELGKPRYQDLTTGTCTLPLIFALDGAPDLAELVAQALQGDIGAKKQVQDHLANNQVVLDKSVGFASDLAERALQGLDCLAPGASIDIMKSMLQELLCKL